MVAVLPARKYFTERIFSYFILEISECWDISTTFVSSIKIAFIYLFFYFCKKYNF